MPIYEYQCRKCSAQVEVMQKMTDKPLAKCTRCGGRLEKQWSSTSFQLKGTGWYVTDYAAKKSETKSEAKEAKTSTTDGKSTKGVEKSEKGDGKSASTKSETASSDKPSSSPKKSSSKNGSSSNAGD